MTAIFFAIGDFFQWAFGGIRWLGNFPNLLFTILAFGMLAFWLYNILQFGSKDEKIK